MKIILLRHLKVIARRGLFQTGHQFDAWRDLYDNAEVYPSEFKIKKEDFPLCFASPLKRAVATAKLIYDGKVIVKEELVEVRNASFLVHVVSLPSFFYSIAGRIAWYYNLKKMPETRTQSEYRAKKFVDELLSSEKENTLVITHGFFMHCLKDQLRQKGFKGKVPMFPKNGHPYVFENES